MKVKRCGLKQYGPLCAIAANIRSTTVGVVRVEFASGLGFACGSKADSALLLPLPAFSDQVAFKIPGSHRAELKGNRLN